MTDTVTAGGQAQADSSGTTAAAPAQVAATGGQAQTTGNGPGAVAEESFFDPRSIDGKPELQSAYKQMQGEFTKRMQKFRERDGDLQLVDRFRSNPHDVMQQMAQQYGYQIVQRGQDQKEDWNPQSWDDVMAKAKQEVLKEMKPVFDEVKSLKKQTIEQQLDSKFADWRTYEDAMMEKLRSHPSLVNDPDALYRLAVPANVWEARATKAAMEKLKGATDHAQISGGATHKQTTTAPTGKLTFDQAVHAAKAALAGKGLRAPTQ